MTKDLNVEVILLGVQPYSFRDRETDRLVEGLNVFFIEKSPETGQYGYGFLPKKANLPIEALEFFSNLEFPYNASVVTDSRFTSRGVVTKIIDFKPNAKVKIG
jgi:hypothetical protein